MKVTKKAVVGNVESNDLMVIITPQDGLTVEVKSSIYEQFGTILEKIVKEELAEAGVTDALVQVQDKGAFDFTIRARMKTAIKRAK